jgi:hypothetical protein
VDRRTVVAKFPQPRVADDNLTSAMRFVMGVGNATFDASRHRAGSLGSADCPGDHSATSTMPGGCRSSPAPLAIHARTSSRAQGEQALALVDSTIKELTHFGDSMLVRPER